MPTYPTSAAGLNYASYNDASSTPTGTSLTANASAHTKGVYSAFIASSGFDAQQITIEAITTSNAATDYLFDIATGAGGAEVVVIANIGATHFGSTSSVAVWGHWEIPFAIAASTRISGRCQCSTGGDVIELVITLVGSNGAVGCTATETIGAVTGSTTLTQIDPGGTANTKGSYTALTASSGIIYQAIAPLFHEISHNTSGSVRWAVDIATGAGGAEVVLIPDLRLKSNTTWLINGPSAYAFLTYIPASTRIAVRAACSVNTATLRLFNAGAVGSVAPAEAAGIAIAIQSPAIIWPGGCASY